MTGILTARASTALSPEWDRWFDEAFTDLVAGDREWVRAEFDALIAECWSSPPPPGLPGRSDQAPEPDRPGYVDGAHPGSTPGRPQPGSPFTGRGCSRAPPHQSEPPQHPQQ